MEATNNKAINGTLKLPIDYSPEEIQKAQLITLELLQLTLCFPATPIELSEAVHLKYIKHLKSLTLAQMEQAFQRAGEECKYFPPPAELRALAGCVTSRQRSEEAARAGLRLILDLIREHGKNLGPKRGEKIREEGTGEDGAWHPEEYERIPCPPIPDMVKRTVEAIGNGDKYDGMAQLAAHPAFVKRTDGEYGSWGERQRAIHWFEERWIREWVEVEKQETALAVSDVS